MQIVLKVKTSNCIGRDKEGLVSEGTFYTLRSKLDPVLDFSSNLDFISILDFKYFLQGKEKQWFALKDKKLRCRAKGILPQVTYLKPKQDWDLNIRPYE